MGPAHSYQSSFNQHFPAWFPHSSAKQPPTPAEFEIALVLAGAVSGGAYAAGVLDFLFEALDEWEKRRADYKAGLTAEPVPDHVVRLRLIAGASAGSILAAQVALAARSNWRESKGVASPFYKTWVRDCSLANAFESSDLVKILGQSKGGIQEVRSILGARFMVRSARQLLKDFAYLRVSTEPSLTIEREWLKEGFTISMQVNNLRGISYQTAFAGLGGTHGSAAGLDPFLMRVHEDRFEFHYPQNQPQTTSTQNPPSPAKPTPDVPKHVILLEPRTAPSEADWSFLLKSQPSDSGWKKLIQAAMASSAFPIGLPPVSLIRPMSDYYWRYWSAQPLPQGGFRWSFASPSEDHLEPEDYIRCLYTDGGSLINEPYVYAEEFLAGYEGALRHDSGAQQAILMVDPFPGVPAPGPKRVVGFLKILPSLIASWKNNARSDLRGISRPIQESYSRFLLRPSRVEKDAREVGLELASGPLGGYFGIFAEELREHDYRLGRINAQKFLRDRFTLPPSAALFLNSQFLANHPAEAEKFKSKIPESQEYQIIPLCGSAAVPLWNSAAPDPNTAPVWPDHTQLQEKMQGCFQLISERLQLLLNVAIMGWLRGIWSKFDLLHIHKEEWWQQSLKWKFVLAGGLLVTLILLSVWPSGLFFTLALVMLLPLVLYAGSIWYAKKYLRKLLAKACREIEINRSSDAWKSSPEFAELERKKDKL